MGQPVSGPSGWPRRRISWTPVGAGALVAILIAPVLAVVTGVASDSGGLWPHLRSTVLPTYVVNTLWLSLGVGLVTTVVGVSTAWLVTLCRFPGRAVLRWALLLPLAIPAYLGAYAYTDLLQFSGPVQSGLRELFGWQRGDYWFPAVRSLPGAVVLLSLALYPYVYMAARSAFLEQSTCAIEAARTLGQGPWRTFFRIALPLARPSVAAGLTLVLMETLAEFGAVQYCAVDTFATGIYRTFTLPNQYALVGAAQLSSLLLVFVAILVFAEAWFRRRARFHNMTTRLQDLPAWQLTGARSIACQVVCWTPVMLGFVVPLLVFARLTVRGGDTRAREMFVEMGRNSFLLAAVASTITVILGLLLVSALRFHPTRPMKALLRVAGLGYAVPGAVLAIGVLIVLTGVDHMLRDGLEGAFGWSVGLLLSGTAVAVIYGYQTRFLAVAVNLVRASYARIAPSLDGAARTLGRSPVGTLAHVHLPLLRGSLIAAAVLVFVDVIKELPATLMLRPFGMETLSVRVYQLASDERLTEASSGALAIILVGLLPVVILSWATEGRRSRGRVVRARWNDPREGAGLSSPLAHAEVEEP